MAVVKKKVSHSEVDLPMVNLALLGKWVRKLRKVAKGTTLNARGDITLVFDHEHQHELRDILTEAFGRPVIDEQSKLVVWWNGEVNVHHRLEIYQQTCAVIQTNVYQERKGVLSWPFRSTEGRK